MAETLRVYWNSNLIGLLTREKTELSFHYEGGYRSSPGALPLSRHLPLREEAFNTKDTLAFFANLLPEGEIRQKIARRLGVSRENVFALLAALGGDCAGAVSVFSPEMQPGTCGHYRPISRKELAKELEDLPAHPFLAGEEGVRLSLAGAQNKLPIFYEGNEFFIPEGNYPSSHIIKPAIRDLEDTVTNEAFCMNLAREVGLPVPPVQVIQIDGQRVYMVERYDRIPSTEVIMERMHQEDFCQALGIPPEMKYEVEGGPGFHDCFSLVEEWSDEPILDSLLLVNWALFNFLIGNADAHGKNLSFLYGEATIRLAPFYDLLSTAVYPRVNNKFAMKMGDQRDPRYFGPSHLARFAKEIGVEPRTVKAQLKEMTRHLEYSVGPVAVKHQEASEGSKIVEKILLVIDQRMRRAKGFLD
jgi:serine/threonine-protein kinase HipA